MQPGSWLLALGAHCALVGGAWAAGGPAPAGTAVAAPPPGIACAALGSGAPAGPPQGHRLSPKKLGAGERQALARLDGELATATDAARRSALRFQRGRIYYSANQFEPAARGFCELLEENHRAKEGVAAAQLLFDSLSILEWWPDFSAAVSRYCRLAALTRDSAFKDICGKLSAALQRKHAEDLDKQEKFLEAAQEYLALAAQKTNRSADEALYNAAIAFERGGDLAAADAARRRLLKTMPKSPLAKRVAEQLRIQGRDAN